MKLISIMQKLLKLQTEKGWGGGKKGKKERTKVVAQPKGDGAGIGS